jgi:hypothetical protein
MEKMSESPASARMVLSRIRELRGLAGEGDSADFDLTAPSLGDLLRHTRRQLLDCAKCVGLTGVHAAHEGCACLAGQQELEKLASQEAADALHRSTSGSRPPRPTGRGTSRGDTDRTV